MSLGGWNGSILPISQMKGLILIILLLSLFSCDGSEEQPTGQPNTPTLPEQPVAPLPDPAPEPLPPIKPPTPAPEKSNNWGEARWGG